MRDRGLPTSPMRTSGTGSDYSSPTPPLCKGACSEMTVVCEESSETSSALASQPDDGNYSVCSERGSECCNACHPYFRHVSWRRSKLQAHAAQQHDTQSCGPVHLGVGGALLSLLQLEQVWSAAADAAAAVAPPPPPLLLLLLLDNKTQTRKRAHIGAKRDSMRMVSAASTVSAHVKLCQSAEWHGTAFARETNQSGLHHALPPSKARTCSCVPMHKETGS